MAANKAGLRLTLDDGTDLADRIDPRLLELTLVEKRGGEADELSLTLHNHDGQLRAPEEGRYIRLALGWVSGEDVGVGLIDKGAFRVDEVEESGPPDKIQIRARSADFTGPARQRRVKVWKDTTLGAVLAAIAARSGLAAQVHPDLAGQSIATLEQHNKSDHALVQDLGARYDAVATWKNRQLLFMPIGSATTASGKAIPAITLTRQDGWAWSCRKADRGQYDGAEAQWHDPATGQRRTHKTGGTNRKRLKRVYASEAEARQAATAEAKKRARGKRVFTYELAVADMQIQPNARASLAGWTTAIDAASWLIESVETVMGANGLKQRIELQSA
jgi:phage protein D